jgi:hypothetical protein
MDKYCRIPLSLLRKGGSALESLELCLSLGIVNAGIGLYKSDIDSYSEILSMAVESIQKDGLPTRLKNNLVFNDASGVSIGRPQSELLYENGIVGRWLLGIQGGGSDPTLRHCEAHAKHWRAGEVFFTIKESFLWGAIYTAREDDGQGVDRDFRPISWREFRILAAILSSPVNAKDYSTIGWPSIQARACGFHTKALFIENKHSLPSHCPELGKYQIESTLKALEANKFFLRFHDSKGKRGGRMHYSFRHPSREDLAASVFKDKRHFIDRLIIENREADHAINTARNLSGTSSKPWCD